MNEIFLVKNLDLIINAVKSCIDSLQRDGVVVQTSGGIDSATVLKLCELAIGKSNVRALFLPDASSAPESRQYAEDAAKAAGCDLIENNITDAVIKVTNNDAISIVKKYYPDFDEKNEGYSLEMNIIASIRLGSPIYELAKGDLHADSIVRKLITPIDLRILIANTNVKQRLRMIYAYRLAESLHYAVGGTANKDEAEFGFAVKYGDAAADFYPIINFTKKEVITLATMIGVPKSIIDRTPTTDTYSLKQTQQKFFFGLSAELMRIAASNSSTDEQIIEACSNEHIFCKNANNVRSLVKFLSASSKYNESHIFLNLFDLVKKDCGDL